VFIFWLRSAELVTRPALGHPLLTGALRTGPSQAFGTMPPPK
jgi:hypothetical protein